MQQPSEQNDLQEPSDHAQRHPQNGARAGSQVNLV
jgi:hypothetical protein